MFVWNNISYLMFSLLFFKQNKNLLLDTFIATNTFLFIILIIFNCCPYFFLAFYLDRWRKKMILYNFSYCLGKRNYVKEKKRLWWSNKLTNNKCGQCHHNNYFQKQVSNGWNLLICCIYFIMRQKKPTTSTSKRREQVWFNTPHF